jgi:hypothetical protein
VACKVEVALQQKKNGMYIDGHKRDNVVAYRHAFVCRWAEYESQFPFWDNDENPLSRPSDSRPLNLCPLILVTHDESVLSKGQKDDLLESLRQLPSPQTER